MIDLRQLVEPGDTVLWGQGGAQPRSLVDALLHRAPDLGGVTAFVGLSFDARVAATTGLALRSYGALGALAGAPVEVLRCHMSALPGLIRSGRQPVDVVLCQVSPADAEGCHRLGVSVDYLHAALESARVVVAEVDPRVPATGGPVRVHRSAFAATVPAEHGPTLVPDRPGGECERRIAGHVAALVPRAATLQLGVGGLAAAVAGALREHRDLRVHSGLIGDWVVDLDDSGALATDVDAPVVTGTALGSERLYGWLEGNPRVELRPVELVHPPAVTSALNAFVAVNQALQVDLDGQVGAEAVGGRYLGAIGGQVDFLRGAAASPGGVGIIALPSTTRDGASRIVEHLDGPVTTAAADVGWVVTEHGAVDLRGTTRRERARALLSVADPVHRDRLSGVVRDRGVALPGGR
ncbi:acetyl-CoA hydrolase/transferase family protein [Pseudonocardia sp. WMMC193]|uniref:acetyl-CoA hydrolase/transferase family protein n=1 Tax=Pseudonocardia sp. WMMC193 TaxID=2911965 RepID=UPI001F22FA99|nr:acetyl-CoA hydrolase/transferase C-terminal domain-containing protein [Pseudonocardia sp. WMMC193]MCF7550791.1 4-hydroxybutyrate CoA-transferase [Pseudonocardia sp. WMMC193]